MLTETDQATPTLSKRKGWGFLLLLLIALTTCFFVYRIGFPAFWTFDDHHSLQGLESVQDWDSAKSFVLNNNTGPTGRPLSMLSFLVNLDDWDKNPAGFRQINTWIHLANIVLVAILATLIARLTPLHTQALGFGITLAIIWGLHPFLASSVLSVVQRMTLLSASFALLGLIGYLLGRRRLQTHPIQGWLTIFASIIFGTLFATFSKENGALLPIFIGLLELQILSRYRLVSRPYWRPFSLLLFWGPVFVLLGYMATLVPSILQPAPMAFRAFSWDQRLWSEALILWEYVKQIFVPNIQTMGPLQDDSSRIHGMDPFTLAAVTAWVIAIFAAIRLRQTFPIILFGLGFFLCGHLLESSLIQLELYFEHRNYLPSLGLLAIPLSTVFIADESPARHLIILALIPGLAFLLFVTTRGWGDPSLSAERWYNAHPTSTRAVDYKSSVVEAHGGTKQAALFVAEASNNNPNNPMIATKGLALSCAANQKASGTGLLKRLTEILQNKPPIDQIRASLPHLQSLLGHRLSSQCNWLDLNDIRRLLEGILTTKTLENSPGELAGVHNALGLILFTQGNPVEALNHLNTSYQTHANYWNLARYLLALQALGLDKEADQIKADFLAKRPSGIYSQEDHERRLEQAMTEIQQQVRFTTKKGSNHKKALFFGKDTPIAPAWPLPSTPALPPLMIE